MKKLKKTSIILCLILCFFAIVMIGYTAENEKNVHEETGATVEGKTLVIGDDILKVYYDEDTKSLQATEQNGYTWNSVVTDELYSSDKLNENWQKNTKLNTENRFYRIYPCLQKEQSSQRKTFIYCIDGMICAVVCSVRIFFCLAKNGQTKKVLPLQDTLIKTTILSVVWMAAETLILCELSDALTFPVWMLYGGSFIPKAEPTKKMI